MYSQSFRSVGKADLGQAVLLGVDDGPPVEDLHGTLHYTSSFSEDFEVGPGPRCGPSNLRNFPQRLKDDRSHRPATYFHEPRGVAHMVAIG